MTELGSAIALDNGPEQPAGQPRTTAASAHAPAEKPLVSIVMFVRNRVDLVPKAIDSVFAEGYPRLQFVIQDCASTDGTVEAIKAYGSRIDLVSEPDRGTNDGFWRALKRVRGDIIGTILSDEEMVPGAIDRAVLELQTAPEVGAITGDAFACDLSGNTFGFHTGRTFDLLSYLLGDYCPHFATTYFRRQALQDIGFFDHRWKDGDLDTVEFELWCRLGTDHRVKYVPHLFARWSVHEQQMSQNIRRILDELTSRTMIIDRYLFGKNNFFGENQELRDYIIRRQHEIVVFHLLCHDQRDDALQVEKHLQKALGPRKMGPRLTEANPLPPSPNEFTAADRAYRARIAHNVAQLYRDRGQVEEALQVWTGAAALKDETIDAMAAQLALSSPTITDETLQKKQIAWAAKHAHPKRINDLRGPRDTHPHVPLKRLSRTRRLALGYNGTLWNIQTGRAILLPVMAAHDRNRVKVIGYSFSEQPCSVTSAFDEFHVIGKLDQAAVVDLVRSHQVDIFIETNGLSNGNLLGAMAARCAPIQVSYVNHCGTCGVPNVDYVLTDNITARKIDARYYSEAVYPLPNCFLSYTYSDMWAPPVAPPPFLKSGYVTFGNFGGPSKLNLECLRLWATVLSRVPDSKLLLQNWGMNNAGNAAFVRGRLKSLGIDPSRVMILPGADRDTILKNYDLMDICLDSWPYCGGNTIAEALWQGVPVITLKGTRFVSAYGASLCIAAGLGDLVAEERADFADIAVRLAADRDRLIALRNTLRSDMVQHGISDPKRMARDLENAYFDMVHRAIV